VRAERVDGTGHAGAHPACAASRPRQSQAGRAGHTAQKIRRLIEGDTRVTPHLPLTTRVWKVELVQGLGILGQALKSHFLPATIDVGLVLDWLGDILAIAELELGAIDLLLLLAYSHAVGEIGQLLATDFLTLESGFDQFEAFLLKFSIEVRMLNE